MNQSVRQTCSKYSETVKHFGVVVAKDRQRALRAKVDEVVVSLRGRNCASEPNGKRKSSIESREEALS